MKILHIIYYILNRALSHYQSHNQGETKECLWLIKFETHHLRLIKVFSNWFPTLARTGNTQPFVRQKEICVVHKASDRDWKTFCGSKALQVTRRATSEIIFAIHAKKTPSTVHISRSQYWDRFLSCCEHGKLAIAQRRLALWEFLV